MNKLMKTLLSVVLIALIAVPATLAGFDSIDTRDLTIDNDDNTVTFRFNADSDAAINDVTITARNTETGESATVIVDIPNTYGTSVPATFTTESLGINGLGTYTINVDAGAPVGVDEDINVIVVTADPEELLADRLIDEVEIEDDDLTFNDEIEFEIDFELEVEDEDDYEAVREGYFEVALFDEDGEKVAGWIRSEDDNIRFDTDRETFDQDDLRSTLAIPSSDDVDSGDLTLEVRVYGDYAGEDNHLLDTYSETFEVERLDDHLNIDAITFEQQGNILYTAIIVENDGEENQEDVRARVQITALDVKQTSNMVTVYEDDDATLYVPVVLPTFTTGDYDIKVTVYNDDVSVSETAEDVELTGIIAPTGDGVVIGVDTAVKTVSANGAVYAMTFTNQGATARTFTLETAGAEWAQTSVNPATVIVDGGSSEIASVFVAPNAGEQGMRQFTVFIKEGAQIVKTISLTANVEGGQVTGGAVLDFDNLVSSGLKWVAAILVVVLIVLFVMWSWRRSEEEEL